MADPSTSLLGQSRQAVKVTDDGLRLGGRFRAGDEVVVCLDSGERLQGAVISSSFGWVTVHMENGLTDEFRPDQLWLVSP